MNWSYIRTLPFTFSPRCLRLDWHDLPYCELVAREPQMQRRIDRGILIHYTIEWRRYHRTRVSKALDGIDGCTDVLLMMWCGGAWLLRQSWKIVYGVCVCQSGFKMYKLMALFLDLAKFQIFDQQLLEISQKYPRYWRILEISDFSQPLVGKNLGITKIPTFFVWWFHGIPIISQRFGKISHPLGS